MKTKLSLSILTLLLSCILLYSCNIRNQKNTVPGDQDIVSQSIKIDDYDIIAVQSAGEIIYTQHESDPAHLTIDIDKNLLPHTDIHVENRTLIIAPKDNVRLKFTKFVVKTNSKHLKKITIAGSGNVSSHGKINAEDLDMKISGSGNITINELEAKNIVGRISGSGDINLKGIAANASYSIAGSGNIQTKELAQETVNCNIAGSGNITVNAKKTLTVKIAGSGDVYYIGNPSVDTSVAGSGKVKKIEP